MAVITPVGNNEFVWSPKSQDPVVKTASTKKVAVKTDKDFLYEAAKKVVAQFGGGGMGMGNLDEKPCDAPPCDSVETSPEAGLGGVDGVGEAAGVPGDIGEVVTDVTEVSAPEEGVGGGEGAVQDVQKAVKELVDKANKAEEVAAKVQDAVGKVEQAVQEVKDAVGGGEIPDEVEIDIEDDAVEVDDMGGDKEEKSEKPDFGKGKKPDFGKKDKGEKKEKKDKGEKDEKDDKGEKEGDEEIVQESCMASTKEPQMKSAAADNDLVPLASLSPSVKRKVYDYYKNDLKYAPDYCKLLVQDN